MSGVAESSPEATPGSSTAPPIGEALSSTLSTPASASSSSQVTTLPTPSTSGPPAGVDTNVPALTCALTWINSTESKCISTTPPTTSPPTTQQSPATGIVVSNTTGRNATASTAPLSTSEGLPGGAVAGVAVGMFLAGLLIAGAVFFFLLRRQKQRKYNPAPNHPPPSAHNYSTAGQVEKGPTVATSSYASNIDDMLPQPAADDAIIDAALKIRDSIKNHVREFYHVSPVLAASINQANMRELAIATGTSSSVLASMLSNTSTRAETLRLIVAWTVLSRCTGERAESLLPGELAPLASAVPGRDGKNAAQSAMYSKWKAMTGALLHGRVGQDTQDRLHRFASAAADLDTIVAPFVQSGLEAQRRKNLDMILARSANFAFLLFEQPGVFRFGFSSEHGGLAVFPALLQTIGDQGQVLVPSRVLLEKEIAA